MGESNCNIANIDNDSKLGIVGVNIYVNIILYALLSFSTLVLITGVIFEMFLSRLGVSVARKTGDITWLYHLYPSKCVYTRCNYV